MLGSSQFNSQAVPTGAARVALDKSEVTIFPNPQGIKASPDFGVQSENGMVFTYKTPAFSFATFAFSGECEVVVVVNRPIKHPVIRPLALGIIPKVKGNTLRIHLTKPCRLAVEVDDDLRRPLFLFAEAPETNAPYSMSPGVRYFSGGKIYDAGTIQVKDYETIYLAGGAVVRGVIRAKNVTGARILGPGILDASMRTDKDKMVDFSSCTNIEMNGPIVLGSYGWTIVPEFSENILLRNLKVLGWRDNDDGVDVVSSQQVTVENCFFRTKDDCIAVKALVNNSKNTVASNNFEPVLPPIDYLGPCESSVFDVKVLNSIFWSSPLGHALTVGFELRAPIIRNILFQNCDIIKKEKGFALSIDNADFGMVDHVRFEDIRVEDGCDQLLMLQVGFFKYSGDCPFEYARRNEARKEAAGEGWLHVLREKHSQKRGKIRDVLLKNVQIEGDRMPGTIIQGFNSVDDISNVEFENVTFQRHLIKSAVEAKLELRNTTPVRFVN